MAVARRASTRFQTDGTSALATVTPAVVEVSIVMPCLNEEGSVGACVNKGLAWLESAGVSGEVVVVDNGSRDGSVWEARRAGARVVFESRRGYGSALRRGISSALGRYVVMGDCDDTYDFGDLGPFLAALRGGADIVVGNRYAGGIRPGAMTWSHRYLGTPVLTFLVRLFSGSKLGDSQCGLRAFSRVAYDRLALQTDGMEFASEMLLKAARQGLSVTEVPIGYYPRIGEAKLDTFRDGWRHLRFLLLATPNTLYTIPGVILALLGCAVLGLTLASPEGVVPIKPLAWKPVFAGSLLLVTGLNALFFGGVAHLYTSAVGVTQKRGLVYQLARRFFRFERAIVASAAILVLGLGIDLYLAATDAPAGSIPNREALAAVAQAAILSAGNFGLAGFLASLIRASDGRLA